MDRKDIYYWKCDRAAAFHGTGDYLRDANDQKQFDYGASRPSGQQTNFNSIATLYDDKYALTSYSLSARAHMDFMGIGDHWSEG